jgi:hypothetical protein
MDIHVTIHYVESRKGSEQTKDWSSVTSHSDRNTLRPITNGKERNVIQFVDVSLNMTISFRGY